MNPASHLTGRKPYLTAPVGFTLIELLSVITILALLASAIAPAVARNNPRPKTFQCLENFHRLAAAWSMYAEDNQGRLVYNPDGGSVGQLPGSESWVGGWMDFSSSPMNTNTALLVDHDRYLYTAFLGPYVRTPSVFRCPGDPSTIIIGGQRYPRVRSVSMNSWVGERARKWNLTSAFQLYARQTDIRKPTPANLWVFLEEHPQSINDGVFFTDPDSPSTMIDYPAASHGGACTFGFADGHSDIHKWRDPRTAPVLRLGQLLPLNVPLPGDPDVVWLRTHATSRP